MNKFHVLMMTVFVINSLSMYAAEEDAQTRKKNIVRQQFEESLDRLRRCVTGQCTKKEALKAARDVGVAAVALVTALYVTGAALKKGAGAVWIHTTSEPYRSIANVTYGVGGLMQTPGARVVKKIWPVQVGDRMYVGNGKGYGRVISYNPFTRNVTFKFSTGEQETIPLSAIGR